MVSKLPLIPKLIYIPQREIIKLGKRWIIYLPQDYSELWERIKSEGKKVKIYIEIVDNI